MIIVDGHEDIAYNTLCFNRDYTKSVAAIRAQEANQSEHPNGVATTGLPDSLNAGVALIFSTLFAAPATGEPSPWDRFAYHDARTAFKHASTQYDYYERLFDEVEQIRPIRTIADLDSVLATWDGFELEIPLMQPDEELDERKRREMAEEAREKAAERARYDEDEPPPADPRQQGFVLLMENADPIIEPAQFEEWYERGVRIVGPAWQASRYAGGTGMPGPLTDLGRELLEVMASFNAILDLSHMAEEAYLEAVERYEGAIIASHSNPRRFCDTDRHLSDEMIRLLAERDGMMGVVVYNKFLQTGWIPSDGRHKVPYTVVLDAIDYICQLVGNAAHVGVGTDFDGGFGMECLPEGLDSIADLPKIAGGLRARGYSDDDVTAIMGGNLLRKLRAALPAS